MIDDDNNDGNGDENDDGNGDKDDDGNGNKKEDGNGDNNYHNNDNAELTVPHCHCGPGEIFSIEEVEGRFSLHLVNRIYLKVLWTFLLENCHCYLSHL